MPKKVDSTEYKMKQNYLLNKLWANVVMDPAPIKTIVLSSKYFLNFKTFYTLCSNFPCLFHINNAIMRPTSLCTCYGPALKILKFVSRANPI